MYWSGNSPVFSQNREREREAVLKSKKLIFDQLLMSKKPSKILIVYFNEGND